jgi:hypothetical protein
MLCLSLIMYLVFDAMPLTNYVLGIVMLWLSLIMF